MWTCLTLPVITKQLSSSVTEVVTPDNNDNNETKIELSIELNNNESGS